MRSRTVLGFVLATMAVSAAACDGSATTVVDTGMRGRVWRGPVRPGPQIGDEPDEAPFRALFHVLDRGDHEVGQFRSDGDGRFEMLLAPGVYLVVPDASAPLLAPTSQRRSVTIPGGEIVDISLHFDTGIR